MLVPVIFLLFGCVDLLLCETFTRGKFFPITINLPFHSLADMMNSKKKVIYVYKYEL